MKHVFLDFDRTLFDTERFYNALEAKYIKGVGEFAPETDLSPFLYPDVIEFIEMCHKEQYFCYLLTFGSRLIQQPKFEAVGLMKYFKDTFYVESGAKVDAVMSVLVDVPHENIVFIDDTIEHLAAFAKKLPGSKVIRMCRPGAKGSERESPTYYTVSNLENIGLFL